MKCSNSFNCNGFYVLKSRFVVGNPEEGTLDTEDLDDDLHRSEALNRVYPQGRVPLAAHSLPLFAQCCECGVAPYESQPEIVAAVIKELLEANR